MGLEILNHTDQKLISNADFWQLVDFQRESNKFSEFKGISFVSNIKFIEKNLLPRFDQITLILGLTDNGSNSIGKRIDQILNKRRDLIEYSYEHQDSTFTKRILDGSLQLFFTKQNLIHTKLYLMRNQSKYSVFSGSMNLTDAAVNKNMEQLVWDYGNTSDPLFNCYQQMFQDKEELRIHVMQDSSLEIKNSPNSTGKDIIILPAEEIKKYRDHYSKDDELKKLSENEKLVASQTVTLFGEGGNKRRKLDTIGQDLYSLTQHIIRQIQHKLKKKKISSLFLFSFTIMVNYSKPLKLVITSLLKLLLLI